jgi:hypothetical protein
MSAIERFNKADVASDVLRRKLNQVVDNVGGAVDAAATVGAQVDAAEAAAEAAQSAADGAVATVGQRLLALTRARMVQHIIDGDLTLPADGTAISLDGLSYVTDSSTRFSPVLPGLPGLRWAGIQRLPQHFGAKGDGSTDDTVALAAMVADHNARGGVTYLPAGTYLTSANLNFSGNGASVIGAGRQRTWIMGGGGIRYAKAQGVTIGRFSVAGSVGDGVNLFTSGVSGGSSSAPWSRVEEIHVQGAGAKGIVIGECFMIDVVGLHSQGSAGIGIDASTHFKTTFRGRKWHATDSGSNGIKFGFAVASSLSEVASDRSAGYGVFLQNLERVSVSAYGEYNQKALFGLYYDAAWTDNRARAFRAVTLSGWSFNDDQGGTTAPFAHLTASSPTEPSGSVTFADCHQHAASVAEPIWVQTGSYRLLCGNENAPDFFRVKGGSFSPLLRPHDESTGLSVAVAAYPAATAIATLGPASRNGTSSYGGLLVVHARRNSLSSASRAATYVLGVTKYVGASGTVALTPIQASGDSAGSASDSAGFTFALDYATNELRVTPAGSTSANPFFFDFAAMGNLAVVPV